VIEKDVLERKSLGDVKVSVEERIERGARVKKYVAHYRQRTRHLLKLHSRIANAFVDGAWQSAT
jgi:hypothetical protein